MSYECARTLGKVGEECIKLFLRSEEAIDVSCAKDRPGANSSSMHMHNDCTNMRCAKEDMRREVTRKYGVRCHKEQDHLIPKSCYGKLRPVL